MSDTAVLNADTDRAAWLTERRNGLGGSDIAAILGVSPWRKPIDVWLEKTGRGGEQPENDAMRAGRRLEPVVAEMYGEAHDLGETPLYQGSLQRNKFMPWMLATPDYVYVRGGQYKGVEIKTSRYGRGFDDGQTPPYYLTQLVWYGLVCEIEEWDLAVLIGGVDYSERQYHRDSELEVHIYEAAARFWCDCVLADRPPLVDESDSYRRFLASRMGATETIRIATAADCELLARYRAACAAEEAAEAARKLAENELLAALGEDAGIEAEGIGRITFKAQKGRETVDTKALRAAHPEIVAKFTKVGEPSRVLRKVWKEGDAA